MTLDFSYLIEHFDRSYIMKNMYHNSDHAESVLHAASVINPNCSIPLILAALYHDCIYIPGAGSSLNEDASAALLNHLYRSSTMQKSVLSDEIVASAATMIKHTTINYHLSDGFAFKLVPELVGQTLDDLSILLDADIHTLAADYDSFKLNQINILSENFCDPYSQEALKASRRFLSIFTNKKSIYRTEYAKANWETAARNNIKRWIESE